MTIYVCVWMCECVCVDWRHDGTSVKGDQLGSAMTEQIKRAETY